MKTQTISNKWQYAVVGGVKYTTVNKQAEARNVFQQSNSAVILIPLQETFKRKCVYNVKSLNNRKQK